MALDDDYIRTLEAENDELREKVRQLEAMLGFGLEVPPSFDLTRQEAKIFGHLMTVEMASKQSLMSALYFDRPDDEPDIKIVDVFICKLRAKLKLFDLKIETVWGQGFLMSAETKSKAQQLLHEVKAA